MPAPPVQKTTLLSNRMVRPIIQGVIWAAVGLTEDAILPDIAHVFMLGKRHSGGGRDDDSRGLWREEVPQN